MNISCLRYLTSIVSFYPTILLFSFHRTKSAVCKMAGACLMLVILLCTSSAGRLVKSSFQSMRERGRGIGDARAYRFGLQLRVIFIIG